MYNTFVSSSDDIQACTRAPHLTEVLIETSLLAREGRLSHDQSEALAAQARSVGLTPVLVWDILMNDQEFDECAAYIQKMDLTHFSAIRVQCVGAARFIQKSYPQLPIQLIAETANCNLATLELWSKTLSAQLQRIILSTQLPAEKICEYVRRLPVECEILAVGRILLFYSRRNLLFNNFSELGDDWREVIAESEQSGNRPFPVIDNRHGTFMFLDKDQYILHKLDALAGGMPAYLRIDVRHLHEHPHSALNISEVIQRAEGDPEQLRHEWPRPTIAPFFKSNLTTKQFRMLNSELRYSRDERCLAEVISTERASHCVMRALQPFTLPLTVRIIDPTGHEAVTQLSEVLNVHGETQTQIESDQVIITPWIRKISVGALALRDVE